MIITGSIVIYNTPHHILNRIIMAIKQSKVDLILFLIDNSETVDSKINIYLDKKIFYIKNKINLGYGNAHNMALEESKKINSEYHFIFNPDIFFNENVLEDLIKFISKNPQIGQVMPKVYYPNMDLQYLCKLHPSPYNLIIRRFLIKFPLDILKKVNDDFELHSWKYDTIQRIPILSGCFMLLRMSVIEKVGGFDKRFFMYLEDFDLTRRIGEVSETIFYPHVFIIHDHAKNSYKNIKATYIHLISAIKYFNKWGWIFDDYRVRQNMDTLIQLNFVKAK